MRKLWLAIRYEYTKTVRQKSFLIALFSLPLFIGLSVGLGMIMSSQENNSAPVGYVDHSGVFDNPIAISSISERERIEFIQYADEEEALNSLRAEDTQAYFIIPLDYPDNKAIELFFYDEPGENSTRDFYDFIQLNLIGDFQPNVRERVAIGSNLIFRSPDGLREFPDNAPSLGMFLPFIVGLGFVLLLLISAGSLMSGFLDEKSNRTIELLVTSLSPAQLVGSKLLTMLAIGLTMLATWILVAVAAFAVGGSLLDLTWLQDLSFNWRDILTVVVISLPSYMFAAALMLAIGLIVGDKQEAESVGPLFFVAAFIPLWFLVPIANDINGPLATSLSMVPLASILTIGVRSMFIQIPLWQVLTSIVIQLGLVLGALWLAIRTFRIGMLRTGKRIRWNELITNKGNLVDEEAR
jgi:ABC-2 type transport system permease protein